MLLTTSRISWTSHLGGVEIGNFMASTVSELRRASRYLVLHLWHCSSNELSFHIVGYSALESKYLGYIQLAPALCCHL